MIRIVKGVLWFVLAVALIVAAMYVTGNYELAERLTAWYLVIQPWLPLQFSVEHFLIVVAVASLLLVVLCVSGCIAFLAFTATRLSIGRQQALGEAAAAKRAIGHIEEQHYRQYEQFITLGQTLTKRLDKRVLVQAIVEAASRLASVPQANGVVSLWLLRFETDTLRFETGLYCDETLFAKAEFQPTDQPFLRVLSSQSPLVFSTRDEGLELIKPERGAQMGAATALMLIPLIIEHAVLGVLVIFCHPDILKSYEERKVFYNALWGELALALAIAIQGELAIIDRLTSVHNREYFMKRLVQEIERANRYQFPLSVLMVDIDNFKLVNDTLGHPQGDAVLKIIAKLIKKETRAIDLVGRYGGEEFIILLPETGLGGESAAATGAHLVAERIRKAVDEEFRGLQKPLNLTISLGVAVRRFPEDRESDYRELIRLADEQLYRAKTTGKNKVCVYVPEKAEEVS